MIFQKIYKIKLLKADQKLYDLWGKELIKLQKKYFKVIEKILQKQYKAVLKELEKNTEVKYNDLYVDQTEFIKKDFSEDLDEFIAMITGAFTIGIDKLNVLMAREVKVEASFWLKPKDALDYAKEYAGNRIKNIDDYSRKRINKLISEWIEKGWWYNKLADALQRDYAFSPYRARLIASNEIWNAYLVWKDRQFARYKSEFGQTWWKHWISHKDDRTTDGCLENDEQGWIPYDQEHQSWHMHPTRFPWCRCNEEYRLFDPND